MASEDLHAVQPGNVYATEKRIAITDNRHQHAKYFSKGLANKKKSGTGKTRTPKMSIQTF
jgi:hypothetical protein